MIDRSVAAGDPFAHAAMSKARAEAERTASTRHHRVDREFLGLLEEDFGISTFSLIRAFEGVPPAPKKEALALCEWAISASKGDPEEAGDALRAWARKNGRGGYDPRIVGGPPLTFDGHADGELRGCEVAAANAGDLLCRGCARAHGAL